MVCQLNTYSNVAHASDRSDCSSDTGITAGATSTTTNTITTTAGSNRRARRPQKATTSMRSVRCHSVNNSVVIRYPDSTKNTSTPRNPPVAQDQPP